MRSARRCRGRARSARRPPPAAAIRATTRASSRLQADRGGNRALDAGHGPKRALQVAPGERLEPLGVDAVVRPATLAQSGELALHAKVGEQLECDTPRGR